MKAYVVEREALIANIEALKQLADGTPIWAVLKGNGYGLGLLPMAKILLDNGIDRFAVTELREAELLRENGFTQPILMLRSTQNAADINTMLDLDIIMTVGSYETAVAINAIAGERADMAEVHLAIDTGMGRYGFLPTELDRIISVYTYMKSLAISGVYMHFHSAQCSEKATRKQYKLFSQVLAEIHEAGFETGMTHCCNSSAFVKHPDMRMDAVRVGSALLGRLSFKTKLPLRKVGYAEALVEELRWLPKGQTVGYGAGFTVKEPVRAAVVSLGWYNGFAAERTDDLFRARDSLRNMYHHFKNLFIRRNIILEVNGHKCRILGRVGMVNCVVDVTGVDCAVGDRVVAQVNPLLVKGMKIQYR